MRRRSARERGSRSGHGCSSTTLSPRWHDGADDVDGEVELPASRTRTLTSSSTRSSATGPRRRAVGRAGARGLDRRDAPLQPRLLTALPDGRDRRDGPRLPRGGRRGARELAELRHHARADAARKRRAHTATASRGRWPSATAWTTSTSASSQVDMSAANLVSTPIAKRYQAVPVAFADKRTLLVAMADPSNVLAVDDIAIMTGYEVRVAVAPPDDIPALIARLDRLEDVVGEAAAEEQAERGRRRGRRPARELRGRARRQARQPDRRPGASSGAPRTSTSRPKAATCACASASTACCRTSRPSRGAWPPGWSRASRSWPTWTSPSGACPRTGASGSSSTGRHVDLRVVTLPSVHGEGVVMRVLDKSVVVELDKLGMAEAEREVLRKGLRRDPRRGARHRADRLGEVDDALRGAAAAEHARRRTSSRSRTRSSTKWTGSPRCRSPARRA